MPRDISLTICAKAVICDLISFPEIRNRLDRSVPKTRNAMAQRHSFVAVVGSSFWNDLPPSLRAKLMTGFSVLASYSLREFRFPQGFHPECASE